MPRPPPSRGNRARAILRDEVRSRSHEQPNSGPRFAASLISEVFAYPDYSTLVIEHRIPGRFG